jgi:magnesium-transporting ATPase (P-type)
MTTERTDERESGREARQSVLAAYWALDVEELSKWLQSGPEGLSAARAAERLREYGPNELRKRRRLSRLDVLVRQLQSPLLLLLVFAAAASAVTGDWLDAGIRRGIEEGRKTFANTLKYVLITSSANLGNMVSMAAASLFLPFLPLTAGQILLNNFLSDIPAVGLADDSVDPELVDRPRRWDIGFIGRYMVEFGFLSSLFDFLTFGALLGIFRAAEGTFRTGWFVASLLTELVVALVTRTQRPFFRSRPSRLLLVLTMSLIAFAFAIPYLPFASVFGFVPLPGALLATVSLITVLYVAATELQKRWFYRNPG